MKRTPPPQARRPPVTTAVIERYIQFLRDRRDILYSRAKLRCCHDDDHVARVNRERYKLFEWVPANLSSCTAGRCNPAGTHQVVTRANAHAVRILS